MFIAATLRLFGRIGLYGADDGFASDFVEGFGTITRSKNTWHIGLQMCIGQNTQQDK